MHERCVGEWKLGTELNRPEDVTRPEVKGKLEDYVLPRFSAGVRSPLRCQE